MSADTSRPRRWLGVVPLVAVVLVALLAYLYSSGALGTKGRVAEPTSTTAVTAMTRVPSLDATGSPDGTLLPNRVLAAYGRRTASGPSTLSWTTASGRSEVAPSRWLAYREPRIGRMYWIAGPGGAVALAEPLGPGMLRLLAVLVDANDAARQLTVFEARP